MRLLLLVTAVLAGVAYCAGKETVHIRQLDLETGRHRRSVDESCPSNQTLVFPLFGEQIVLHLLKSDINPTLPGVSVVGEDGSIDSVPPPADKTVCMYLDVNTNSSLLMECDDGTGSCHVDGSFTYNSEMYTITPTEEPMVAEVEKVAMTERHFDIDDIDELEDYEEDFEDETPSMNRNFSPRMNGNFKRTIPSGNIVELLVCPDESVYQHYLNIYRNDADTIYAMRRYYALVINSMDLHFMSVEKIDSSISIRIYLSGVVIAKTAAQAPWSSKMTVISGGRTYLSKKALGTFRTWRNNNKATIPHHDFAIAYTRKDYAKITTDGTIKPGLKGLATLGSMCKSGATAIVEDIGQRAPYISAHELGHGLGANHDGAGGIYAACGSKKVNVMSSNFQKTVNWPGQAERQWSFSSCSVQAFKNYITNKLSANHCMLRHEFSTSEYDDQRNLPLPGSYYSIDRQCQFILGPAATHCNETEHDFIPGIVVAKECYNGVQCRKSPDHAECNKKTYYVMAGTPCRPDGTDETHGTDKWCFNGLCKDRSPGR